MARAARITAWQPPIAGLREVLHADFPDHAYPMHTHDSWTVLIVDAGLVRYDLDRHEHGALTSHVTVLPPNVPHDGRSVHPEGFRKRVLYLEPGLLSDEPYEPHDPYDPHDLHDPHDPHDLHDPHDQHVPGRTAGRPPGRDLTGAAVDHPGLTDPLLRQRVHQLHQVLAWRTEHLEAQSRLLLIQERLQAHLRRRPVDPPPAARDPGVAGRLRALLDARVQPGLTLDEAALLLNSHPTHLVRAFSREYGLPPHLYLTGRRVDLARKYLLDGRPGAEVAALAGFFDQSHLTRHFRRMLGVSPARYARGEPVSKAT